MPKTPGLSDLSPERCNAEPAGSRFSAAGAGWPRCSGVLPRSRHPCRHADTAAPVPGDNDRTDPHQRIAAARDRVSDGDGHPRVAAGSGEVSRSQSAPSVCVARRQFASGPRPTRSSRRSCPRRRRHGGCSLSHHGQDCGRLHHGIPQGDRREAGLWSRRRLPQRLHRRTSTHGRHRLDPHAPRGGRRLRCRCRSAPHRRPGRLRRQLWAGQPPPDQWALRLPPEPGAGSGGRRPHPEQRDRHRLFPGDPPGEPLQGVQPLRRAGVHSRPATADTRARDSHRDRAARRRRRRDPRRGRAPADESRGSRGGSCRPGRSFVRATPIWTG